MDKEYKILLKKEKSVLSTNINEEIKISAGFQKVLEKALYWGEKTNGALDVSVMPSIVTWRKGFVDSFESEWKPPLIGEIISAKDKVGYAKVLLRGNILIKVFNGQGENSP